MAVLIAVKTDYSVDERNLSHERLQQAARLKKADDKRRCLCAGVALDEALRTIGLREKAVRLATNTHGKPYLADYPQWHFNVSHSGDWAVCVLSTAPIGVDIEQYRAVAATDLARRYFSAEETAQLQRLSPSAQVEQFFRLWTKKESLLKAKGVGLSGMSSMTEEGVVFQEYALEGYALTACGTDLPLSITVIE